MSSTTPDDRTKNPFGNMSFPISRNESTGEVDLLGTHVNESLMICLVFVLQLDRWTKGKPLEVIQYGENRHDKTERFKVKKLSPDLAVEGLESIITQMRRFQAQHAFNHPVAPLANFGIFIGHLNQTLVYSRVSNKKNPRDDLLQIEKPKDHDGENEDPEPVDDGEAVLDFLDER